MTDKQGYNVAVLGGGSAYTPGLVAGLLRLGDRLPLARLVLVDIDEHKLKVVGELVRHMVETSEAGRGTVVSMTADRVEGFKGADFILSQIRVGGLAHRALDERIPNRYGVLGQETTGPGGFAMALRSIPVMLDVARDIRRVAPEAWLINYTNPTGLVADALHRYAPDCRVISICDMPMAVQFLVSKLLGMPMNSLSVDYVGLNHLGWTRHLYHQGVDLMDQLHGMVSQLIQLGPALKQMIPKELGIGDEKELDEIMVILKMFHRLRVIPSPYLQYYYDKDESVKKQLAAGKTRAEVVMEIEQDLLGFYGEITRDKQPELWKKRGGDWHADMMMGLVAAIANDTHEVYIVNVPNRGAVEGIRFDKVVEIPAVIGRDGARPLVVGRIEPDMLGLMQVIAAYEELTVEAAAEGSREKALRALSIHPLIPSLDVAEKILNDYLEAHREFLPTFR
ncbi:MAG TPA: 6-phospho-beta-glucosidase [Bacillota bacterium]|jgi:6-phospho-beta-glucosidase